MEDVVYTLPNPVPYSHPNPITPNTTPELNSIPNTAPGLTPNTTPNSIPNTAPELTPNTNPIELKSPKKEGDDEPLTNKRKPTRTSNIWNHFTKVKGGNPKTPRCNCNYCGADYACPSANGTSSLWVHFRKCKKNPEKALDKKQKIHNFKKETGGGSNLLALTFNKVRCRNALAKFVELDEQAFKVVEGDGFRKLIQELQPMFAVMFAVPRRVTIARDVNHLYFKEMAKLMKELTTTNQRKKIINFCQISNHKGDTIGKAIEICLLSWGIEKVFTVTLDNASANKEAVGFVRRRVNAWKGDVLGGENMHGRVNAVGSYQFLEEDDANKIKDHATSIEKTKTKTKNINIIDV